MGAVRGFWPWEMQTVLLRERFGLHSVSDGGGDLCQRYAGLHIGFGLVSASRRPAGLFWSKLARSPQGSLLCIMPRGRFCGSQPAMRSGTSLRSAPACIQPYLALWCALGCVGLIQRLWNDAPWVWNAWGFLGLQDRKEPCMRLWPGLLLDISFCRCSPALAIGPFPSCTLCVVCAGVCFGCARARVYRGRCPPGMHAHTSARVVAQYILLPSAGVAV